MNTYSKYIQVIKHWSYSTFPAFTLPLPLGEKLLDVVRMKPGRIVKIHDSTTGLWQQLS